jgi:UDP-N-acetylmuramyl pentapeptide phosphotransferase/UDP-N-acetylglucosamine-1-phosphate transferase
MGDGGPGMPVLGLVLIVAAAISAALIVALRPLLVRYALARPNARSSHREPTPQGGGIAVVAAALAALWLGVAFSPPGFATDAQLPALTLAALTLALTGAVDDIRGLGAALRLVLQAIAVGAILATLPASFSIFPQLPRPLELAILLLGGMWFVNLVNFMDGIDWMTVAEVVPVAAGVALLGLMGAAPEPAVLVALALLGGMIGFAPFNRPVARLFLGDVGSLPIGLMLGWILLLLAGRGHPWRRCCCRSTISPTPRSRSDAGCCGASASGRRIAHTSISAQPSAASRSARWSCASSFSTSRLRRLRW